MSRQANQDQAMAFGMPRKPPRILLKKHVLSDADELHNPTYR